MVRSAAAVIAVLILPAFALAQEPQGSHTVVDDDTLWDLAQQYYSDPWEWRVIWEANRSEIDDPNLIYPDQVFTIPGLPADDRTTTVETDPTPGGGEPKPAEPEPRTEPAERAEEGEYRTIFYRQQTPQVSVVAMMEREYVAVDVNEVYSAPWLGPLQGDPEHVGVLRGFALDTDRGSTVRQFHQVSLDTYGTVRVGDRLRTFRVTRSIPQVGQVVVPTGIVSVTAVSDTAAVGVVTQEYGRIQAGDFLGPLPSYSMTQGARAEEVTGGPEAMIMGFATTAAIRAIGHAGFIDLGSDHGITVGDEFVLYGDAVRTDVRGRLQVVSVQPTAATVRITSLTDDVFRQGVIVRLVRQMP
ncbi:MAG: LysM peptidoglycan-binding domain-containing protein [Gemmatimonadota bacterium]|nr:LysM peptidoglycan-binding domain-containing protein [Gemmatimonadota bacterium]